MFTTQQPGPRPAGSRAGPAPSRPATTPPAIEVAGLSKRFGPAMAVQDLSFTVGYGRITGLLGPNGAGKTTTLRALLGLIKPDAGTARIAGRRYTELADPAGTVGALLDAGAVHPGRTGLASGVTGTIGFPASAHLLGQLPAALVLAGYAMAIVLAGGALLRRRDIAA